MKIKHLFRKFTKKRTHVFPDSMVHRLLSRLENTHEEELSCDEVFALVDVYAEAYSRGEDVDKLMPLLRHHLDMCKECEEEYQALVQVLEGTALK